MTTPILVTGGLGFIGSAFVRRLAAAGLPVTNADADTYAGDARRLAGLPPGAVRTELVDVADPAFAALVARVRPATVVHFAAETHVTRGERDPERFFRSNVEGTRRVLEACEAAGAERVLHVSTDEVYGPFRGAAFREEDKGPGEGAATSAYARSKALADDLARSFAGRVPVVVARPTNCFGPWQHPEKAIPRWTTRALRGEPLPVWGDGRQVRDWMHVDDACEALATLVERGEPGEAYNVGPEQAPVANLEIARAIAAAAGRDAGAVYLTDYDRPQHDRRYAVDASRLRALGWAPTASLERRLAETVRWYREHAGWWEDLVGTAEGLYADAGVRGRDAG